MSMVSDPESSKSRLIEDIEGLCQSLGQVHVHCSEPFRVFSLERPTDPAAIRVPRASDLMSREAITISVSEKVSDAASMMLDGNVSGLVAVDDAGRFVGTLSETDLVRRVFGSGLDPEQVSVEEVMTSPLRSVGPDATIGALSQAMAEPDVQWLPVVQDGTLLGLLDLSDLVGVAISIGLWRAVRDVMRTDVATASPECSLADVARIMAQREVCEVVVVEEGTPVGILTEGDMVRKAGTGQDLAVFLVLEEMASPVLSIEPGYAICSASTLMRSKQVQRLLISQKGQLRGLLTHRDIFQAFETDLQTGPDQALQRIRESRHGVFVLDLDQEVKFLNSAFVQWIRAEDAEELIGAPFLPNQCWQDPALRAEFVGEMLEGPLVIYQDAHLRNLQGDELRVIIVSFQIFDHRMEVSGYQGLIIDFTDPSLATDVVVRALEELGRRVGLRVGEQVPAGGGREYEVTGQTHAERVLAVIEKRYHDLVQFIPDIVYKLNEHGRITFINNSVRNLGYEPEELIGKHFRLLVHPQDLQRCAREAALRQLRGQPTGWEKAPKLFDERRSGERMTQGLEIRLLRKDQVPEDEAEYCFGEIIATGTYTQQVEDNQVFAGTVGIIRDITRRRAAQMALWEREEQLRQSQKKEAVGLLAAGVAHEINNALTGILGNAMLIQLGEADGEVIDVVIQEARRAAKVVQDLMMFARPMTTKLVELQLSAVVERVIRLTANDLSIRKIEIESHLPDGLGSVKADGDQVQQVLLNLVLNARDAMNGEGKIIIAAEPTGEDFIACSVSDTGSGIEEEVRARMFDPFFTTKETTAGTGLGLSVVQGIVQAHGGRITAENVPDGGARLTFYLLTPAGAARRATRRWTKEAEN